MELSYSDYSSINPLQNSSKQQQHSIRRRKSGVLSTSCGCLLSPNGTRLIKKESDIEEIMLCRCQQSNSFPLCDGTHEIFNSQTNSNMKPISVKLPSNTLSRSTSAIPTHTNTKESTTTDNQQHCCKTRRDEEMKEDKTMQENISAEEIESSQPTLKVNIIAETPKQLSNTGENTNVQNEQNEKPINDTKQQPENKPTPKRQIKKIEDYKKITAVYTAEEVAKHNTRDDCWLIVKDKVYDITPYFDYHPGGYQALLNFAGKDGTENVEFHSSKMLMLLDKYFYIGKLKKEHQDSSCVIS